MPQSRNLFSTTACLSICIDLTHGRRDGNRIFNKQMSMDVDNISDSREIRLTARYKFNASKSKYKGKGAAGEELKRL